MAKTRVLKTYDRKKLGQSQNPNVMGFSAVEQDVFAFTDEPVHTGFISSDLSGRKRERNSDRISNTKIQKVESTKPHAESSSLSRKQHDHVRTVNVKKSMKAEEVSMEKDKPESRRPISLSDDSIKATEIRGGAALAESTSTVSDVMPPTPSTPKMAASVLTQSVELLPQESDVWSMLDNALQTATKTKTTKPFMYAITSPIESIAPLERRNSIDNGLDNNNINENLEIATPLIAKKSDSMTRALSVQKTYNVVRSYLSEDTGNNNLQDLELHGMDEDDDISSPDEKDETNIRSFNELRAMGGQSHFMDEAQYLMDGLKQPGSSSRASLLELAEKMGDSEFRKSFKSTSFPQTLFELFGKHKQQQMDDLSLFLFAFVVYRLLDNGTGLAASVVELVLEDLADLLQDTLDICRPSLLKKSGTSKNFQQMFKTFVENQRGEFAICSGCLILLNILVLLEESGGKVSSLLVPWLSKHGPALLSTGLSLLATVLEGFENHDDEGLADLLANITLLHLLMVQYEHLVAIGNLQLSGSQGKELISRLVRMTLLIIGHGNRLNQPEIEQLLISGTRVLILLTTLGDEQQRPVLEDIYSPEFSHELVSFVSNSRSNFSREVRLYGWGLLINIIQDGLICGSLLDPNTVKMLKSILKDQKNVESQDGSHQTLHYQGCQYLVLGLLATVKKDTKLFSAKDMELIKQGLSQFEQNLNEEWGRGLQRQIARVLRDLDV